MRLVFHVGAHRTATTFLQKTFSENAEALAANGVAYIRIKPATAKIIDVHNPGRADNLEVVEALENLVPPETALALFSWEAMIGLPYQGQELYGARNSFLPMLELLAKRTNRALHTILTFRRQDDFLNSYFSLMVKAGYDISPDDFKARFADRNLSWGPILKDMQQIGSAHAVPFESCKHSPTNYVNEVLRGHGSHDLAIPSVPANESLGTSHLEILAFINRHTSLDRPTLAKFRVLLDQHVPKGGKPNIYTVEERNKIVRQSHDDNMALLRASNARQEVQRYYLPEPTQS